MGKKHLIFFFFRSENGEEVISNHQTATNLFYMVQRIKKISVLNSDHLLDIQTSLHKKKPVENHSMGSEKLKLILTTLNQTAASKARRVAPKTVIPLMTA